MSADYDCLLKFVIIGTCYQRNSLLHRFIDGTYIEDTTHFYGTLGMDVQNKLVDIDGSCVKLMIWGLF